MKLSSVVQAAVLGASVSTGQARRLAEFGASMSMSFEDIVQLTSIADSSSAFATGETTATFTSSKGGKLPCTFPKVGKTGKGRISCDFSSSKACSLFFADDEANTCAGKKIALENKLCVDLTPNQPQAGGNVTKGYVGDRNVTVSPYAMPFHKSEMCPVNVHWHVGSEHYSYGQFDENGDGPNGNIPRPNWALRDLSEEGEEVHDGFRCHHYDTSDSKFTTPYDWKHCEGMEVGETYEVHWPHSSAGACGTVNQYQSPFYDGVFCNLDEASFKNLTEQQLANAVGVQGQVFTIVNDESYFYPDMIRGMIVDKTMKMGRDIAIYTGSTTGDKVSNEECTQYAPITWQVDRECHLISASSFDKMCYDMKMQRDDMSDDLHAHGSRELVLDSLVANNQVDGNFANRKTLRV